VTAFAGIALKLLFGGLGLLKKLFAALFGIQVPAIVPVALAVFALIQMGEVRHVRKQLVASEAKSAIRQKSIDNLLDGIAQANKRATAEKRATESRYAQIQKDQAHALTLARADAADRLRDWMRTHRADQGRAIGANLPVASGAATGPDAHDPATFLVGSADLGICTDAFVTARGWQDWYNQVSHVRDLREILPAAPLVSEPLLPPQSSRESPKDGASGLP
jgi:hypothetical protein